MYGFPEFDINEIRQSIATTTFDPVDVKKMVIKPPLYPGHTNYLIYFKKTSRMFGYRIYWDSYKKSNGPVQCHNCQEYFHSSRNCKLSSRCMRYKSSECKNVNILMQRQKEFLTQKLNVLINCQGRHTSNSKDCPLCQQIVRQKEQPLTQKRISANQSQNYNKYFPSLSRKTTIFNLIKRQT